MAETDLTPKDGPQLLVQFTLRAETKSGLIFPSDLATLFKFSSTVADHVAQREAQSLLTFLDVSPADRITVWSPKPGPRKVDAAYVSHMESSDPTLLLAMSLPTILAWIFGRTRREEEGLIREAWRGSQRRKDWHDWLQNHLFGGPASSEVQARAESAVVEAGQPGRDLEAVDVQAEAPPTSNVRNAKVSLVKHEGPSEESIEEAKWLTEEEQPILPPSEDLVDD